MYFKIYPLKLLHNICVSDVHISVYLNVLAVMLKVLPNDSFLLDVHALMLMDDTVLLASTRKRIIEKFEVLMKFCEKHGMVVNELKTQMMVINGVAADRQDFVVSGVVVKHTTSYIYLGSPSTENGKLKDVIQLHVKSRLKDLNKFKIFCKKNETMPFQYKKKVLEAAIMSSLLYGSETWLTIPYMRAISCINIIKIEQRILEKSSFFDFFT